MFHDEEYVDKKTEATIRRSSKIVRRMKQLQLFLVLPLIIFGVVLSNFIFIYIGLFLCINFLLVHMIHRSVLKEYE